MDWIGNIIFFIIGAFLGMVFMAVFCGKQIANLKLWNRRLQYQRDSWKAEARNWREKLGESEKELAEIKAGEGFS